MESARKTWELENAVKLVDPRRDALFSYDASTQRSLREARPWKGDPHHFKSARISAVALLKMVMHARSGGNLEVMGLMLGKIEHETFIITDAYRLPVEGTETRVNAHQEATEYMSNFSEQGREAGRPENVVGWYHSHPGYGCWLSGIDVATQAQWQRFEDPFLAVVVDPDRTISAGKVEIGAFRCFPDGYVPADAGGSAAKGGEAAVGNAAVPMAKAADFGAHANKYYPVEVSHYKSGLDNTMLEALWNKYWVQTLSASPLITNREYGTKQIEEVAGKIGQVKTGWRARSAGGMMAKPGTGHGGAAGEPDPAMEKVVRAAEKIAAEERTGLLANEVKEKIFGTQGRRATSAANGAVLQEDVQMQMQDVK
ncbi:COP9 signalosome complex subunit 5b [Sphaceloma murrayae]|uniref:COP9 signalosome complex subunit 5 n=1 Tax=Sphaceloma murrayae TaxID=2082308 RepID=A0A2K1QU46_9PEZI|nr:COP9 signalosome complex subunit 5b [Sphaceloma murrayae]